MGVLAKIMLEFCTNYVMQLLSVCLCVILYFFIYSCIFKGKTEIINMVRMFTGKGY